MLDKSCNSNGGSLAFGGLLLLDLRKLDKLSSFLSFVSKLMSLLVSRLESSVEQQSFNFSRRELDCLDSESINLVVSWMDSFSCSLSYLTQIVLSVIWKFVFVTE